jgi:pimeloyl-ACP methyl ester carboxylesterase
VDSSDVQGLLRTTAIIVGRLQGTAHLPAVDPDLRATQMIGAGHFLMMEKPDEFNQLVQSFLDEIDY